MSIARVAALPSRRTLIVFAALVSAATGAIDSRAATPALPESDPARAQLILVRTKAQAWITH